MVLGYILLQVYCIPISYALKLNEITMTVKKGGYFVEFVVRAATQAQDRNRQRALFEQYDRKQLRPTDDDISNKSQFWWKMKNVS